MLRFFQKKNAVCVLSTAWLLIKQGLWRTPVQEGDASELNGGGAAMDHDLLGKESVVHRRYIIPVPASTQAPC